VGADIANGGKASAERETGVLHAGDSFARNGNAQPGIAMAGRIAREMRVHIDPGRYVAFERSIAVAPFGSFVEDDVLTEVIVPEASKTTSWSLSI